MTADFTHPVSILKSYTKQYLYYCINCITVLLYYCVSVLLYYCINCITVLLYYCVSVLLYYCINCITVLLYYCVSVLLYYCTNCIIVLLYYCITVFTVSLYSSCSAWLPCCVEWRLDVIACCSLSPLYNEGWK